MATLLAGQALPQSDAALAQVDRAAAAIADPAFQDITDPTAWLRLDILRERIAALRRVIETEVEALAGLSPGFNATDGD
jgi:predicted lipoprotein